MAGCFWICVFWSVFVCFALFGLCFACSRRLTVNACFGLDQSAWYTYIYMAAPSQDLLFPFFHNFLKISKKSREVQKTKLWEKHKIIEKNKILKNLKKLGKFRTFWKFSRIIEIVKNLRKSDFLKFPKISKFQNCGYFPSFFEIYHVFLFSKCWKFSKNLETFQNFGNVHKVCFFDVFKTLDNFQNFEEFPFFFF